MKKKTGTTQRISGLQLVRNVFDTYHDDPVGKLLGFTHGETEYLELKATCVFDKNDTVHNNPGENQNDLSWNIVRELLALYNTKGGVLIIGIDDKPPFNRVPLPDFPGANRNDYLRRMVEDKIFPSSRDLDTEWSVKNGTERYSCATEELTQLRRNYLHMEYLQYQDGMVVALFVDPAPCQPNSCISVSFTKNQGDAYNQMPVRHSGNTGGVDVLTQDDDKQKHEATRHRVDSEFARQWNQWRPQDEQSGLRTRSKRRKNESEAVAEEGCDPSNDPLIRAIEGRVLETVFEKGESIAGYKVIAKIGQGGMGIVYEVEHPSLMTHRALKVFATGDDDVDNDLLKRKFLAEARLLARFNHPGLVRVHTLAVAPNTATLYYEMDLVRSANNRPQTLQDVFNDIQDNPPSNRQLKNWFAQLCTVLHYLHVEQKIVHRDIKLGNILLNERGFAILSDFGIARIRDNTLNQQIGEGKTINPTMNGNGDAPIGTPEYLAPELNDCKATAKSDIFALGVVFFKLLTGNNYHQESGDELKACLKGKPRFWRKTLPKFLARNPKNRIRNLADYTAQIKYPHVGMLRWMVRILVLYAILHLFVAGIHVWHSRDKAASINEIWPVQESVATLTASEPTTLPEDADSQEDAVKSDTTAIGTPLDDPSLPNRSQKTAAPQAITIPTPEDDNINTCAYSQDEIRVAESDIRRINWQHMTPARTVSTEDPGDEWLTSEIDAIHTDMFAIWSATIELTGLGMRIDEVVKSRRDLVFGCINIRRKACNKINRLIASEDYKKALKLYKAVNNEFSNNGFEDIPRPSFTPDNNR